MPLVTLSSIHKSFGERCILEDVSLTIGERERVGFVGPNGTGKTSIFNIIVGRLTADEGAIDIRNGLTIGYLQQEFRPETNHTLHEFVIDAFREVSKIEGRMREIEHALAERPEDAALLKKLGDLQHRFDAADGYNLEYRVDRVLAGLGLSPNQYDSRVGSLSGGEQTKASLARILVEEPDLLLLDEPTNYLDLWALSWLEDFLLAFGGSVVAISHDRYFLDRVATRIIELNGRRTYSYRGNYSEYVVAREKKDLEARRRYEEQKAYIEHQEDYIRRYHAGQRAKEIKGRIKKLDRIERLDRPTQRKTAAIRFDKAERTSYVVYNVRGAGKSYGTRELFSGVDLEVIRNDRLGMIGPNGIGKTTFLRMLLGEEEPDSGEVVRGKVNKVGYFDQKQQILDPVKNVLEELGATAPVLKERELRGLAARFLFRGDDVMKKVSVLSGGEKAMLSLAKIMSQGPSVMILDEPTNHLDIPSREAVEEALLEYDGTLIVVSHDRRLLDTTVEKILVLRDGGAALYLGNYSFYVYETRRRAREQAEARRNREEPVRRGDPRTGKKDRQRERRRLERELEAAEKRVIKLEEEIAAIHALYESDPEIYNDPDRLRDTTQQEEFLKRKLKHANYEWELAGEKLTAFGPAE